MRSMISVNCGGPAALSTGDHHRQDMPGGVGGQVKLGGQAAARAAQRVVVRFARKAVRARPARTVSLLFLAPAAC